MLYRSTNIDGQYTHHMGAIVAGVNSSHGVEIDGGSTGGMVRAIGDDANISLQLVPKGTGPLILGNSSTPVFVAGSTAPFLGPIRFTDTAVVTPNFATSNIMVMETTHVIAGVNSSHVIVANGVNLSTDCALLYCYPSASTAGDVHCRFIKASTLTVAASTATMNFLIFRF